MTLCINVKVHVNKLIKFGKHANRVFKMAETSSATRAKDLVRQWIAIGTVVASYW